MQTWIYRSTPCLWALGAVAIALTAAGCSARQARPATPVDTARTPTFRSYTHSYDQPHTPLYTQPGINHGTPYQLKPIATVNRWDQNAPLAVGVWGQLESRLGATRARYFTVQSKGSSVKVGGTASTAAVKAQAIAIARSFHGVKAVVDAVTVQR